MLKLLEGLNEVAGIMGSMVVTDDGIVVSAALGDTLEEATVAAVSSSMISSSKRALGVLGHEDFTRFVVTSTWGRMVFVDIQIAFLIVITFPNIELDAILIEIESAAYRIRNRRAD